MVKQWLGEQVLLNVLADEIHRAHQRCLTNPTCDPRNHKLEMVLEAGTTAMKLLQGAYSCICLDKGGGLVAFRDPFGIRCEAQSSPVGGCAGLVITL